eukprot:455774_1
MVTQFILLLLATTRINSQANVQSPNQCDYEKDETFPITVSLTLFESVIIYNDTVEIQFDVRLNKPCNGTCNILYIGKDDPFDEIDPFLLLSINSITNFFDLFISNNDEYIGSFRIPMAQILLPMDHQYHTLYILHEITYGHSIKTIFSVDNVAYEYHAQIPTFTSTTKPYPFYLGYSGQGVLINADVNHICVNSSNIGRRIQHTPCSVCNGQIKCNQTFTQKFSSSGVDYLYFNLSESNQDLIFYLQTQDSVYTYVYMDLYDINSNYQKSLSSDSSWNKDTMLTVRQYANVSVGEYILALEDTEQLFRRSWTLDVKCSAANPSYKFMFDQRIWWGHEKLCENIFGTTLATIATEQDMDEVTEYINNVSPFFTNITVSIGLYNSMLNGSKWQWIDGTSSLDDIPWEKGQPDSLKSLAVDATNGVYLDTTKLTLFDMWSPSNTYMWGASGYLCNSPKSKYHVKNCSNISNCWRKVNCCDDHILNLDSAIYPGIYTPPLVFWDSKLVVIGSNQAIHWTNFSIFNNYNEYSWNHKQFNNYNNYTFSTEMISQRWSQYGSSLYLHVRDDIEGDILIHINLNDLNEQYYYLPPYYLEKQLEHGIDEFCMVSNNDNVYIICELFVHIYNIHSGEWQSATGYTTSNGYVVLEYLTCAITNDNQFIYVFNGPSLLARYDTSHQIWSSVDTLNLCEFSYILNTITGVNQKMYLHGCYVGSWKTLIFDPNTDEFETETVDIDYPISTDIANYRKSQMAVFDDNILLLLCSTSSSLSLYFAI